jgi:hypothetical protein
MADEESQAADSTEVATGTVAETPAQVEAPAEVTREALKKATAEKMAKVFADAEDGYTEVVSTPEAKKDEMPADEAPASASTAAALTEPLSPPLTAALSRRTSGPMKRSTTRPGPTRRTSWPTASKLHESRNAQTREMSELGRRLKEQQKAQEAGREAALPTKFEPLDIAALKKTRTT